MYINGPGQASFFFINSMDVCTDLSSLAGALQPEMLIALVTPSNLCKISFSSQDAHKQKLAPGHWRSQPNKR